MLSRITPPSVCFLTSCHATSCGSETSPDVTVSSISAGDVVPPSIVRNFLRCRAAGPGGQCRLNNVPCICFGRRQPLDEQRRREINGSQSSVPAMHSPLYGLHTIAASHCQFDDDCQYLITRLQLPQFVLSIPGIMLYRASDLRPILYF